MLNFDFLGKGFGKSVNMCIAIICQPGCDAINSEINFIFQINPFFYMIEKSRQKSKYLKDEKSF